MEGWSRPRSVSDEGVSAKLSKNYKKEWHGDKVNHKKVNLQTPGKSQQLHMNKYTNDKLTHGNQNSDTRRDWDDAGHRNGQSDDGTLGTKNGLRKEEPNGQHDHQLSFLTLGTLWRNHMMQVGMVGGRWAGYELIGEEEMESQPALYQLNPHG